LIVFLIAEDFQAPNLISKPPPNIGQEAAIDNDEESALAASLTVMMVKIMPVVICHHIQIVGH
jgi:hypothetical protein